MRYWVSRVVATAAVVGTMSFSTSAATASDQAALDPTQPEAKRLLEVGIRAIKDQQLEKAQASLLQAWDIEKHWRIAANLGVVEIELHQYRDAAEHLVFCLRTDNQLPPDRKKALQERFEEARAHVATIDVRTDAVGATIIVDDEVVGHTPSVAIFVEPGHRTFGIRMAGKSFVDQPVDVARGEMRKVVIVERLPEKVPPPPTGPKPQPSEWKTVAVPLGLAATAVGLGIGAGCYVASQEKGISSDVHSNRVIGTALGFSFAGAAFVTTMIMGFWPSEQPQKPRTGLFVAPVVGGGTSGVLVGKSF